MLRRVAPHGRDNGDSLCDDVLLCLIAQPGRQTGQPHHRQHGQRPLTAPTVKEFFWRSKPLTPTDMPRELWLLFIQSTCPKLYGERQSTLRVCDKCSSAVFSQVVFMTERDHKIVT
jgi:hypothetical protein